MTAVAALGLRDRKKEATRQALERTAFQLFETKGFEATTIDEIVEAAGVGRSTFFRYFQTKEDVVIAPPWDATGLKVALARRPAGENPLAACRGALAELIAYFDSQPERMLRQARVTAQVEALRLRHHFRMAAWEQVIAEFVAARRGLDHRADPVAMAIAIASVGAARAAFHAWASNPRRGTLLSLFESMMDVFAEGLAERSPNIDTEETSDE